MGLDIGEATVQKVLKLGEIMTDNEEDKDEELLKDVLRVCGVLDRVMAGGGLGVRMETVGLSAGKAQLFALVRAVLYAEWGGIMLLDEAISWCVTNLIILM